MGKKYTVVHCKKTNKKDDLAVLPYRKCFSNTFVELINLVLNVGISLTSLN